MLDDIKKKLVLEAKKEGEALVRKAEEQVEQELLKEREKGEQRVEKAIEKAKEIIENEKREKMSFARLETKRILLKAKDQKIREVIDKLIEKIKAFTKTKKYPPILKKLIKKGMEEVGKKSVIIHVKKGDKKHIKMKATIKEDANILGGVIIESKDGTIISDMSFDTILENSLEEIRREIYKEMFKG